MGGTSNEEVVSILLICDVARALLTQISPSITKQALQITKIPTELCISHTLNLGMILMYGH